MAALTAKPYPGRGLDLAILTESAATSTSGPAHDRAVPLKGEVRDTIGALARRYHGYILLPLDLAEEGPRGPIASNAAVLFDRQGEVAGIYRKLHPGVYVGSDELEAGITPGRYAPVFKCDFGNLGVQICWDIQFDDGWDALGRNGAEIVAWPTASPATALPAARAQRHRYYVISSTWRDNTSEPGRFRSCRRGRPSPQSRRQRAAWRCRLLRRGCPPRRESGAVARRPRSAAVLAHSAPVRRFPARAAATT